MADSSTLERTVSVILTIATVAVAFVVVEGRLRPRDVVRPPPERIEELSDWSHQSQGVELSLSDGTGPIRIAIFTDFECQFCAALDATLAVLEVKHPGKISRSLVHFPLSYHRFARPASIAAECAAEQGRARQMHDVLFAKQSAFGLQSWSSFASAAGVEDLLQFEECIVGDAVSPRIKAGVDLAASLGLSGTPSAVINGWLFDPASPSAIEQAVEILASGRSLNLRGGE